MGADKWKVIGVMLVAVAAVSVGETLLSRGMKLSNEVAGDWWNQLRGIIGNRFVLAGTLLMMLYFALYMLALRMADLSFVLPLTAFSYLLGALLAKLYLREDVSPVRWLGALVITAGVIIVGLGDSGPVSTP